jgi:hypothetical protein
LKPFLQAFARRFPPNPDRNPQAHFILLSKSLRSVSRARAESGTSPEIRQAVCGDLSPLCVPSLLRAPGQRPDAGVSESSRFMSAGRQLTPEARRTRRAGSGGRSCPRRPRHHSASTGLRGGPLCSPWPDLKIQAHHRAHRDLGGRARGSLRFFVIGQVSRNSRRLPGCAKGGRAFQPVAQPIPWRTRMSALPLPAARNGVRAFPPAIGPQDPKALPAGSSWSLGDDEAMTTPWCTGRALRLRLGAGGPLRGAGLRGRGPISALCRASRSFGGIRRDRDPPARSCSARTILQI